MAVGRPLILECMKGLSAQREVLLGFAPAALLHRLSFSDVLDEDTRRGYQRRFNSRHSLDFKRYIQRSHSTTIPLTFNLRPQADGAWHIRPSHDQRIQLEIAQLDRPIFSQVDCQHRLGHLSDLDIQLPFMSFIGLTEREEMEIFNVINSKAKGLNSSLLDFHEASLSADLATDRPEIFIAIYLRNETASPWYGQLSLGGHSSSGMTRKASLRTLQKAVHRFLQRTRILARAPAATAAQIVLNFWSAVPVVLSDQWTKPRTHVVTKGVGVYCLMEIAADLYLEAGDRVCDKAYFVSALSNFVGDFDWSSNGPLKGLGGEAGAAEAVRLVRLARKSAHLKVANG